MQSRPRLLVLATLTATAAALAAPSVVAAPSKTMLLRDAKGDISDELDIQRAKVSIDSKDRLRVAVTITATAAPAAFLAASGPPGSLCVRIWTATNADPKSQRPDRLACITARSRTALRGRVYEQDGPGLPEPVGSARVSRSKSNRSFIIRIRPSTLDDPRRVRLAVESNRPGCASASCIDTVPAAPTTRRFRLR